MANYTTSDVATIAKADLITILTDAGLDATGTVAELRARIVDEEVPMNAAPTGNGGSLKDLTKFDAALNSRTFASANASGAESFPLRAYDFDTDTDGNPALVGGTWVGDQIVNDKYAPLKGSDGQELATQPDYIGREKSIKFIVVDNTTGLKYRLSSTAFEAANKAVGKKMSFASAQMGQTVDTSTQYARATVTLL